MRQTGCDTERAVESLPNNPLEKESEKPPPPPFWGIVAFSRDFASETYSSFVCTGHFLADGFDPEAPRVF